MRKGLVTSVALAAGAVGALLAEGPRGRQSLVIGLVAGSGYGLVALGLVLVYKSSGVFNFAQGEFGTIAVFALWGAHSAGVPYGLAMFAGLVAALASGLATERFVVRPLRDAPRVTLLVATAGGSLPPVDADSRLHGGRAGRDGQPAGRLRGRDRGRRGGERDDELPRLHRPLPGVAFGCHLRPPGGRADAPSRGSAGP